MSVEDRQGAGQRALDADRDERPAVPRSAGVNLGPSTAGDATAASADSPTTSEPTTGLTRKRIVIGAIVMVFFIVGLYFLVPKLAGLKDTWGTLRHGDPLWLALGAVFELISVTGYAVLFSTIFGRGMQRIDWRASIEIPLAGIAAIRLLAAAGAGGVAVTAWALRSAGMSARTIACRMVANYAIQYGVYLGALLVCGIGLWTGVFAGGGSFVITVVPAIFGASAMALVASAALLPQDFERRLRAMSEHKNWLGRLASRMAAAPSTLGSGIRTAFDLIRERRLGLLGAVAYWGFDIAVLGVSFRAFGSGVPVAVLIMGYFLGTLGSLLPLPGGIGGVEGGMIGAFVAFGVSADHALIGVLAYRAISFWLPTLPGIIGYLSLRSTVRGWRVRDELAKAAAGGE